MASWAALPELRLLLACARLQPDLTQVRECAAAPLDWGKTAAAAEYHGIIPLLLANLKLANAALPDDVRRSMEQSAGATLRQTLFLTAEMLRVTAALKESAIMSVPWKGPVLTQSLYGDLALRPFSDIDLLLRREDIAPAESVLKALGYEAEFSIPATHRERWVNHQCELTFRRGETSRLELHWDISHPHFALETGVEDFWSRLASVKIGDASLPNLGDSDLLFTLIVHGTRHAWSRVIWLVDIAELLRTQPRIDWNAFVRNANERGAARLLATALILGRTSSMFRLETVLCKPSILTEPRGHSQGACSGIGKMLWSARAFLTWSRAPCGGIAGSCSLGSGECSGGVTPIAC
jgi:hypothetical protein